MKRFNVEPAPPLAPKRTLSVSEIVAKVNVKPLTYHMNFKVNVKPLTYHMNFKVNVKPLKYHMNFKGNFSR